MGLEYRTPALPLREHGADHAVHQRAGPQSTLPGSLRFQPPGDVQRLDARPAVLSLGHRLTPGIKLRGPARVPDQGGRRTRSVAEGRQAACARPDGDRVGQDLHRHHAGLPPAETRRCAARPLSRRHAQSRRAGRTGVHGLHPQRRQPQVHRALQRPAADLAFHRRRRAGRHLHRMSAATSCRKWPRCRWTRLDDA